MDIKKCNLCPRNCGIDRTDRTNRTDRTERTSGGRGFCGAKDKIKISWFGLHFGEEPAISGFRGSGTIFFCHCNLKCVFCQNWQISQECSNCQGYSFDEVVEMMFNLQKKGAHNINLVTPTIWAFWLKGIIKKAKEKGLKIPVLWNSNAYEKTEILKEFEGLVDIYLPDYKYNIEKLAVKYSFAPSYSTIAQKAILEMQKQVGDLKTENGVAKKGLIVRHLILPNAIENTKGCLKFISSISRGVHLSLMSQYNPLYKAKEFGEINRPISLQEFEAAKKMVEGFGIKNGWIQEFGGSVKCLNPDFNKNNPFE